jgi:hypothetical protein
MKNLRLGINWVYGAPKAIAKSLGLTNPETYTGHAFRRTCASWHANAGASDQEMRVHFGWKSTSMASRYTSNSEVLKQVAADRTAFSTSNDQELFKIGQGSIVHQQEEQPSVINVGDVIERPPMPITYLAGQAPSFAFASAHPKSVSVFNFGGSNIGVVNIYQGQSTSQQTKRSVDKDEIDPNCEREEGNGDVKKRRVRLYWKE